MAIGGAGEYFGIKPDLACFAKGLANGLPIAATVGRKEIMKVAEELLITSTYGGETLSLAGLVASIKEYKEKKVIDYIWARGKELMASLNGLVQKYNLALAFKGFPPLSTFNFEYKDDRLNNDLCTLFLQEAAKRGILFRRNGLNFITFSHTTRDIELTIKTCDEVFKMLSQSYQKGKVKDMIEATEVKEGIRKF
jgi:glutamate-1-semialdehyde aminotransferase